MKSSFPLTIFIVALCIPNFSKGMIFNGFQIRDLYTNDATFITDADEWTATAVRHGVKYSQCDGTYLAGGFDILGEPDTSVGVQGFYFQRIYEDLPDHNIIYFTISLWLIDSWDSNPPDYFQLQFDATLAEGWTFGNGNFTEDFCGNSDWSDLKNMTVFGQVSHSGPSLTLRIISQLDDWAVDESLGFRDVNLIFAKSDETNVNELCGLSSIPLPSNQCYCPYGEYFDDVYTFGCVLCNPSCRSCFGSTPQECYECQAGYSFVDEGCIKCDESCTICSGPQANQCIGCPAGMSLFNNEICILDCASTSLSGATLVCDNPCETGEFYFYENRTCSDTCNFPFTEEILPSGVRLCVHSCGVEGYLYWDGTCNSLCPSPLQERIDDKKSVCLYNCPPEEFLYWDGSCQKTCDDLLTPSTYKNRQFCQHPCPEKTDYIFWNGTCGDTCPSPLQKYNDEKANYCQLPCSEEKPYWDGSSCLESCNQPLRVREEDGILFCESPCNSFEYLYWNGSCLDSCPLPYKTYSQESGIQFCSYLCQQYGDYFYPREGECFASCDAPFTPKIQIIDDQTWYVTCMNGSELISSKEPGNEGDLAKRPPPPKGPFYFPITAIRIASEKIVGVFIALDIVLSLLSDSHVMILILVIKILNFIRFIDVRVPPQLVQEFHTYDHNHFYLNFGPGMSEEMEDKFTKTPLPMVFERAGLHSRFFVNFFKPITSFLIMLGLMIMIAILQRIFRKKTDKHILIKIILKRLGVFMRWNLVVLLVVCNIDEIVLFSILEWKTVSINSGQDAISLLISFGMAILSFFVIIAPLYLLHKIYQTRFKVLSNLANQPYFELLKKIEGFQVIWKDFKDSSWHQKAFLPLYFLRIALIYLIIALLYKRPMLQTVLLFLLSLGMLAYMSIVKPFMKKLDFIQSIMYEVCMLISIGSTLILAVFDSTHTRADQVWIFLGDCIMFCNIWVTLTSVLFFLIKFCREGQSIWRFYRVIPKPISWPEFWVLVLQENDPINHELKRNKRTSTRLDLTGLENEIQRKNLASYHISFISSAPNSPSQAVSIDETQPMSIPRKSELRIRKSLFSMRKQSSDSDGTPVKTGSTYDDDKSPFSAALSDNFKNKILSSNDIKKNPQDSPPLQGESEEKLDKKSHPEVMMGGKGEASHEKKIRWKNLETIKEVDSIEISRIKTGEQTKRLENLLQDTTMGDLGCLSVINKRLSSETMMQKIEETVIIKEKEDLVRKRLTTKIETVAQDSLFV